MLVEKLGYAGIECTYNEDNKVISLSHVDENGNPNYETYENVKGKRITLESAYAIIRKTVSYTHLTLPTILLV